jgi:hypothetical protein
MAHVDAQKALTYVSDQSYHADVIVFDRDAKQVGKITSGLDVPAGIFVDRHHNLWVADDGGQNVLEYARGGTSPIKTLSDPNVYPNDVTICANGTVYVANYYGVSQISGNVVAYAKGSITPTRALSWPGQGIDEFITCDASNNVFTTLFVGSAGTVVEYPHGKQSGAIQLPITLNYPGGIKPDKAGNLLVVDSGLGTVTEYTEAGSPTGESMSTFYINLAVARSSDVVLGSYNTTAIAMHFPSGVLVQTYSGFGAADGVAFDPGQKGI